MLRPSDDPQEPFKPDLSEGLESGLYLALLELVDEGLIIASDELILDANSAACHLLERSYGELVRRPLAELFPSEQAFLTARERMFIQGQMRGSLQIALPGGRHREMRFCAAARLRPGLHALILSPDYLAESGTAALEADTLWPRLAAAVDQPVIVVDDAQRVVAANAGALRRLQAPREALVGRRLDEHAEIRWPAPGAEPLALLRLAHGETQAARLLPGPRAGWKLLILPPDQASASPPPVPGRWPDASDPPGDLTPSDLPARHDGLTGLPPLGQLAEGFAEARARARGQRGHIAVLKIDVGELKAVNDRLGHGAGDRLLQQVAQRLRAALPAARMARQGGGAFVALLPEVHFMGEVEAAAEGLAAALGEPLGLDGQAVALGASIGVAVFPRDGTGFDTLLGHAEIAREQAARTGGAGFYADEMNSQGLERRALEASLRHALERGELEVHFVPEWRRDGLPAAEALLRWRHPDLGLIPTRRLLPLLRHSGLLAPFGAWALAEACAQAARWAAQDRELRLIVNIALEQLAAPEFAMALQTLLANTGLPPDRLELDLEEAVLTHGEEVHLSAIDAIAGMGIGLAIDNFGQGPWSLPRLAALPIRTLRLDPGLASVPRILEATLAMAQPLGLEVVAKGVKDQAQRDLLVDMGFAALQGPGLGGPLNTADFGRTHLGLP